MSNYHTTRRIEFRDTDAAGIAHFSTFFDLMEEVEHELLRSRELQVFTTDDSRTFSWPRVHASCDFHSPVKFDDIVEIDVDLVKVGEKSLTYKFSFSIDGRLVAVGKVISVCCQISERGAPKSIEIPEWFSQQLLASD